jgi:hypothetical protein
VRSFHILKLPATEKLFKSITLEGFSQLVSVFIDINQNFIFYFLHNKADKKIYIYQRIYRKC